MTADRLFLATVLGGRLHPNGIPEWGPWEASRLHWWPEDHLDKILSTTRDRIGDRKVDLLARSNGVPVKVVAGYFGPTNAKIPPTSRGGGRVQCPSFFFESRVLWFDAGKVRQFAGHTFAFIRENQFPSHEEKGITYAACKESSSQSTLS